VNRIYNLRIMDAVPTEDVLFAWQQALHDGLLSRYDTGHKPVQSPPKKRVSSRVKPRTKGR